MLGGVSRVAGWNALPHPTGQPVACTLSLRWRSHRAAPITLDAGGHCRRPLLLEAAQAACETAHERA